jgi:putative transposase
VYHVLNRSVAELPLFRKEADYEAFERIMIEGQQRHSTRVLVWCWMRNHWHFVVWPQEDGELTAHSRWLAHRHAMRWHVAHGTVGRGHLYQGRFECFPVEGDEHFFTVCRYVERNALTAGVVGRADWRRVTSGQDVGAASHGRSCSATGHSRGRPTGGTW